VSPYITEEKYPHEQPVTKWGKGEEKKTATLQDSTSVFDLAHPMNVPRVSHSAQPGKGGRDCEKGDALRKTRGRRGGVKRRQKSHRFTRRKEVFQRNSRGPVIIT